MEILARGLKILAGGHDISNEQRFYFLSQYLKEQKENTVILKEELNSLLTDQGLDIWQFIADNQDLIENVYCYSRTELCCCLKVWFWDYLYPELKLTASQIDQLSIDVTNLLRENLTNSKWMFSYPLYDLLKTGYEYYGELEYYNLWKIDFEKNGIERRPIQYKEEEIGFLGLKT